MPAAISFGVDFSSWLGYSDVVDSVMKSLPSVQRAFLSRLGSRYRGAILARMNTQGIRASGTYEQSVQYRVVGSSQNLGLAITLNPTGREASRLPIYWSILEFGGRPNPNVPSLRIKDWMQEKWGTTLGYSRVANKIRSRGIPPRPVLGVIFRLTPPGVLTGVTPFARDIAEEEGARMLASLEEIFFTTIQRGPRIGQQQARIRGGRPGGGRFAKVDE